MTGRAVTAVNLFGIGGGALLQWGLGLLIGLFPDSATGKVPLAYTASFLLTAGLCFAGVLLYAPLRGREADLPSLEQRQKPLP
jgi:hypothetical protein